MLFLFNLEGERWGFFFNSVFTMVFFILYIPMTEMLLNSVLLIWKEAMVWLTCPKSISRDSQYSLEIESRSRNLHQVPLDHRPIRPQTHWIFSLVIIFKIFNFFFIFSFTSFLLFTGGRIQNSSTDIECWYRGRKSIGIVWMILVTLSYQLLLM